ncbi:hypothetical protein MTX26_27975 [Bradyrhizobium sp. ISRA443]|uniref:hypothetical protein n=1 Tax=unclassified Bradyrhizobium TaxID=2631580 RepID=UPI00247AF1A2|nr:MULTISPECIES: hypothetical protein [unclassified Bradyrhizobium]WGR98090.1 hypothetical protein MTX23_27965 [Bradyrhizobium sp. ISRA436]WGS04979.1 hypothetical protein MTX18_27970 [Bradyrhizobium sp. ISRA437]WGS11863.1 hypothetical protein MTX26_27975 [Bradyrhizobium sp. ISRA443]
MDPFNSINPFDRDFAAYNAAVPQPQQQQAEFEPYLDEVPQLDTTAVDGIPVSPDRYNPHLSDEDRRFTEASELGDHTARGPHPPDAVTRRVGDAASQRSASREALNWPKEMTAEGHDQDPPRAITGEVILASSLKPAARDHQTPDPGEAVRHSNWSYGSQPAHNELTGSLPLSSHAARVGEDYSRQLCPAKRQRTLGHAELDAIERQLSEPGNSIARVLMESAGAPSPFGPAVDSPLVLPEEGYDQDQLWAMVEDVGPSSSLEPTARHQQTLDSGAVVRPFNFRQGDQHVLAAPDGSSIPPSQDSRPNSFLVHTDRYTALFVPAAAMRRSTPLNPPGAAIRRGSRLESVPQPSARPANPASPARLGRSTEQAAPASSRAERTSPAVREIYAASWAVPEGFSHGTQPAPPTMISKLGRWGLLPDAAQPEKQYDIRGERYTALLGPGGPNDVRLIHYPRM